MSRYQFLIAKIYEIAPIKNNSGVWFLEQNVDGINRILCQWRTQGTSVI